MKITKSQLIKIIKEEIIQELGFERGFSPALKQIASELEEMIVSRLGAEDVTVDIDEWGPTEYDEPAGGEIRVSWKVGAIDAGSITSATAGVETSSPSSSARGVTAKASPSPSRSRSSVSVRTRTPASRSSATPRKKLRRG